MGESKQELPEKSKIFSEIPTVPEEFKSSEDLIKSINKLIQHKSYVSYLYLKYSEIPLQKGAKELRIELVYETIKENILPSDYTFTPPYNTHKNVLISHRYYCTDGMVKGLALKQLGEQFLQHIVKHIFFAKDAKFKDARGEDMNVISFQTILGLNEEKEICECCEKTFNIELMIMNEDGNWFCPECVLELTKDNDNE